MSHAFDTGLVRPQRTAIELAVLALLQRLKLDTGAGTGYLRTLLGTATPILGREDDVGAELMWDKVLNQTPAVLVYVGSRQCQPAGMGGHQWGGAIEVTLYVVSQHLRSREARMHADPVALANDTKDPGIAVILEHCAQLLAGQDGGLGPSVTILRPTREDPIAHTKELLLWEQVYSVQVSNTFNAKRDITQELVEIYTTAYPVTGNEDPPVASTEALTPTEEP